MILTTYVKIDGHRNVVLNRSFSRKLNTVGINIDHYSDVPKKFKDADRMRTTVKNRSSILQP